MKKALSILIPLLLCLTIIIFLIISFQKERRFYLDDEYYSNNSLIEINSTELKALEDNKKTFVVFVYQPLCITSYDLDNHVKSFLDIYKISFYKILFTGMNDTKISNYVKYCPSLVIYQNGKVIAYLDADSNKDAVYYESIEGLTKWVTKYILLKE